MVRAAAQDAASKPEARREARSMQRAGKLGRRLAVGSVALLYVYAGAGYLPEGLTGANPLWLPLTWPAFFGRTFAVHIALALLGAVMIALAARRRRLAVALLPLVLLGFVGRVRDYVPLRPEPAGPTLRVMSLNVMGSNTQLDRALGEIERLQPDVLCLVEYNDRVHAGLGAALAARYPFHVLETTTTLRGAAIYARLPLVAPPEKFLLDSRSGPAFRAELEHAGQRWVVYCVHLQPPSSPARFLRQRQGLATLRERLAHEALPTVVCGDFNFTNDCPAADVLALSGFTDVNRIRGSGPEQTWSYRGLRAWLPRVRIDHILLSAGLTCRTPEVGQDAGSDHRAVVADVGQARANDR